MRLIYVISIVLLSCLSHANELEKFSDGPLIKGFGKHTSVGSATVDDDTRLRVAFDVGEGGDAGKINRRFDSLARFLNMHVAAGVQKENINLALVVHGLATMDLLKNEYYKNAYAENNANLALLELLMQSQVKIILCGQSVVARGVAADQIMEGVHIELSAMTAHALLQAEDYTLNPF